MEICSHLCIRVYKCERVCVYMCVCACVLVSERVSECVCLLCVFKCAWLSICTMHTGKCIKESCSVSFCILHYAHYAWPLCEFQFAAFSPSLQILTPQASQELAIKVPPTSIKNSHTTLGTNPRTSRTKRCRCVRYYLRASRCQCRHSMASFRACGARPGAHAVWAPWCHPDQTKGRTQHTLLHEICGGAI
jgi:hypothetical protein